MIKIEFQGQQQNIVDEIEKVLKEGSYLTSETTDVKDINEHEVKLNKWRKSTVELLNKYFKDGYIAKQFSMETVTFPNKFSKQSTIESFNKSIDKGCRFLESLNDDINKGIHDNTEEHKDKADDSKNDFDKTTALKILRKILCNFHKHIESMYREPVHRSGHIKMEDLNKIKIINEYDVQRILYSLIRPIFPEARLEVPKDAGYKSKRYDIFLDEFSIIIEVKCTRSNMTEHKLTEELGSDAFHYKCENLFMFVFDKENIIKNVDAFQKAYSRQKNNYDKEIEAIVIQSIIL